MDIEIPDFALIVLIGSTGAGKSTFAARHFDPSEIVAAGGQGAAASSELRQTTLARTADRLERRLLTVVDATNVQAPDRKAWVDLARQWHARPVAVVLDPGPEACRARNRLRGSSGCVEWSERRMTAEIRQGLHNLGKEGFRRVHVLDSGAAIDGAIVHRIPVQGDLRVDRGPFDVIGDVHGCADELEALLGKLGYRVSWSVAPDGSRIVSVAAPPGRKAVFAGDLVDRGPRSPDVLRIVMSMVEAGIARAVMGNHDRKMLRWLSGANVKRTHGFAETVAQMACENEIFHTKVRVFLDGLPAQVWLDGGDLVVAHAGLKEGMIGRSSGAVRMFTLFGDTTGEMDSDGLPVRLDWSADYRGRTVVAYGHVPTDVPQWVNGTICIDSGCVFGGALTALRWPERELVAVPAFLAIDPDPGCRAGP